MNKHLRRIPLQVDRLIHGGLAIGRYEDRIVMIQGAVLPGERVEVTLEREKKDYAVASVFEILEPARDRIEPDCGYFGLCGGCHLQHMPYDIQIRQKEAILRDTLRRLAKTEIDLSETLSSDPPWRYRHRGQFKVVHDKTGFYRGKSRDLVEITACPLMRDEINSTLGAVRALLKGHQVNEIHISCGDSTVAFLKIPGQGKSGGEGPERLASDLIHSGLSGVIIETGDKEILRYGSPSISLRLGDQQYSVSAMSFLQGNWKLNQSLVTLIEQTLHPLSGKRVLDLYSGAGNFSLPLAPAADVTGVEENRYTIEDGRRNLEVNRIAHYRFIHSPAEKFQPRGRYDIVLLDPPRAGLSKEVVQTVLALKAGRVAYVSCDPATFARDVKALKSAYDIESVRLIDFFPQTYHIEVLAFLRLR